LKWRGFSRLFLTLNNSVVIIYCYSQEIRNNHITAQPPACAHSHVRLIDEMGERAAEETKINASDLMHTKRERSPKRQRTKLIQKQNVEINLLHITTHVHMYSSVSRVEVTALKRTDSTGCKMLLIGENRTFKFSKRAL